MTKAEALEFLGRRKWAQADQKKLVDLHNELRGDTVGKITTMAVRTPCRLRQVRGALIKFVENEMK